MMETSQSKTTTAPVQVPSAKEVAAAATSGIATKFWLELKAYPAGSPRSLWLFVGNAWRNLDNPDLGTQISVQDAFCKCPDRLQVMVWYDNNNIIVGLVVNSK